MNRIKTISWAHRHGSEWSLIFDWSIPPTTNNKVIRVKSTEGGKVCIRQKQSVTGMRRSLLVWFAGTPNGPLISSVPETVNFVERTSRRNSDESRWNSPLGSVGFHLVDSWANTVNKTWRFSWLLLTCIESSKRTAHKPLMIGIQSNNAHSAVVFKATSIPSRLRVFKEGSPDTQRIKWVWSGGWTSKINYTSEVLCVRFGCTAYIYLKSFKSSS